MKRTITTVTIACFVMPMFALHAQRTSAQTRAEAEALTQLRVQMIIDKHPDPDFKRDMRHWLDEGRVVLQIDEHKAPEGLNLALADPPKGTKVGILINPNHYLTMPPLPEARRQNFLLKQLEFYLLYVQIRNHFNGTEPIVVTPQPPQQQAAYIWRSTRASTGAQWQLLKRINRIEIMPALTAEIKKLGFELGLTEYLYRSLLLKSPPEELKLYGATWRKLYEEEVKELKSIIKG